MLRGKDTVGRPVVTRDTGEKVGELRDLVIDRSGNRVLGIVLDEKGLFGSGKVIAWPAVRAVGLDSVIIDSKSSIVKTDELPEIQDILEQGYVLIGSRVQTTGGRVLGEIENVFFNPETGAVEGYELIGGANAQQQSGSAFLPAHPSFEAGKEYSYVDPAAVDTIEDLGSALRTRA
jgi:uncharacterized protein YrrD